jgi:hypothetical protein
MFFALELGVNPIQQNPGPTKTTQRRGLQPTDKERIVGFTTAHRCIATHRAVRPGCLNRFVLSERKAASKVVYSTLGGTGLEIKSFMPASRQRCLSSRKALAVMARIGVRKMPGQQANLACCGQPVHIGHLHVHQDEPVIMMRRHFHSLYAILCLIDDKSDILKHHARDFPIDRFVLCNQHKKPRIIALQDDFRRFASLRQAR